MSDIPLILLSGHRTGSSLVMGMLVSNGLHIGPSLPPTPDNPKGYFENAEVVSANTGLLGSQDRDWTCPPHRWEGAPDQDRLTSALATAASDSPWGIKDPRMLFTLPAWLSVLPKARFVGVHRPTEAVARSISARDGIPLEAAMAIADAHARRLLALHRDLGFPVLRFAQPGLDESVGDVARALGLGWDPGAIDGFFDPTLIHHDAGEDELWAEFDSTVDPGQLTVYDATIIRRSFRRAVERTPAPSLRRDVGPVYEQRLRELWGEARRADDRRGTVVILSPNGSRVGLLDGAGPVRRSTAEEITTLDAGSATHVLAPGILDTCAPEELDTIVERLSDLAGQDGVVALSGHITIATRVPDELQFDDGTVAGRRIAPYLHQRDEVELAFARSRLHLLGTSLTPGGLTRLVLGTADAARRPDFLTLPELRLRFPVVEAELRQLRLEHQRDTDRIAELTRALDRQTAAAAAAAVSAAEQLRAAQEKIGALSKQLSDQVAASEALRGRLQPEIARLTQKAETLNNRLAEVREAKKKSDAAYRSLKKRRSVRMALKIAGLLAPVVQAGRGLRRGRTPLRSLPRDSAQTSSTPGPPKRKTTAEVVSGMLRVRQDVYPERGRLVSILILTRNGATHLRRLLPALDRTTYRSFEVVIVDNGSTDETADLLEQSWTYPVKVISNDRNVSFSEGNNQAAAMAEGEYLLLLNNDLEPITDNWLGAMVRAAEHAPTPSAVGALLVYPDRGDPDTDLTVQHRGIAFTFRNGAPHAVNMGGEDPADPTLAGTTEVPAVTAAALLCRRADFDAVGGLTSGYVYGAEDVDFCLKLRERGPIVLAGAAALFHHESATQRATNSELIRINRMGNWRLFAETWGPQIGRSIITDRLTGRGEWTGRRRRTVAITISADDPAKGFGDYYTGHELGDAFAGCGWTVIYAERHKDGWYDLPDDVDLIVSLLEAYDVRRAPAGSFTIAWVRNWVDRWVDTPWFDSYDMVVAASARAAEDIGHSSRFDPPVLPIATNPERFSPGPAHPTFEADFTFTGNNWGRGRSIVPLLDIRPGERFLLFGKNWDSDPRIGRYWRGHLDYDHMADLYRSVKIVLDDSAEHTLPHGLINSRVFDALAAGALVLTNNQLGSDEQFAGLIPVYRDRAELRRLLSYYLEHETERIELVERLRTMVLTHHTYGRRAEQFVDLAVRAVGRPRVAIKVGAPRAEDAHSWGDYHFANSLVSALAHQGFDGEVHLLPDWDAPSHQRPDVVIHLRGLTTYAPKPAQLNIMWLISHPDDVAVEEFEKYDLVCVASKTMADELTAKLETPVLFMAQATDAHRFGHAEPDPELRSDVLFVGNSRGHRRPVVDWAIESGLPLTLYGSGWDGLVAPDKIRDSYFPNERLGALYASAKVVLNDHWPDMKRMGIASNRIFDALASGSVVISDAVEGLAELFEGTVPTFDSAESLADTVHRHLDDSEMRAALARRGREIVLSNHTFDHRAAELAAIIRPMLQGRARACAGVRFDLSPELDGERPPSAHE